MPTFACHGSRIRTANVAASRPRCRRTVVSATPKERPNSDAFQNYPCECASIVECPFFGGLSIDETAEALGIAPVTVRRSWLLAKTRLQRELGS